MIAASIYLASPYSHPDPAVEEERARLVSVANAHMLRLGYCVYSPIAHCHPLRKLAKLPGDAGYWQRFDRTMISDLAYLLVYRLPGWEESVGVQWEIGYALSVGSPIRYLDPLTESQWAVATDKELAPLIVRF